MVVSEEQESEGTARLTLRGAVIGLVTPAIATAIAFPVAPARPEISIALFMLAVVIAAVAGGLWAGLIAGILASTLRPLVVEDPQLTFRFNDVEDVATGVVFLSVALVVGLLVGQASEDRARASRREREARFLGTLSSTLHTREVPDRVLDEFADVLLEPFALSRVEIDATLDGTDLHAVARSEADGEAGPRTTVPAPGGRGIHRHASSRSDRPVAGRSPATISSCSKRRPARRPPRSIARAWTRARGTHSSTPKPTSSAPRCSRRSPTICGRPSRRSRRA